MSTPTPSRRAVGRTRRVRVARRSFSSRNPTPIGAIGLVLVFAALWAAFNVDSLPIIGGGTHYTAYFSEAAGLRPGDPVRIAGVKVGSVDSVALAGDQVTVRFKVKDAFVGDRSTAAIKLKTLLGAKYLAIDSLGGSALDPSDAIPRSRTHSPFDVYPAFTELTSTLDSIDTTQLAKAFTVLAQDFSGTPSSVRTAVTGLTRLSTTVSSRDAALRTLLAKAEDVTGVLAGRSAQLRTLLRDGGRLLDELNARRAAIHSLLVNTATLSIQLQGVVSDNRKRIGPLLDQLDSLLRLLRRHQDNLDRGLALLGPFYRVFNNTEGNGRWFDNYIQNLSLTGLVRGTLGGR